MIPERYKKQGFNKIGQKRQSTRPGKKWMVLAKKGDSYKIVHGGDDSMQDYTQHHSEQRRKNFWNRMGGKNSSKATDPFSPLYWHKRFGTWAIGGENTAKGQQEAFNQYMLGMFKDSQDGEDFNPYTVTPDFTFEVSDEIKNKLKKNRQEISPIRKYGENLQYDIKTGTGQYDFSPEFQGFNALAQITTGIANMSNDAKARRYENDQYLKALTPQPKYNYNEAGLNNIPLYGNGGKTKPAAVKQAFVDAYNNYNSRTFPAETLPVRQKAYRTINPSDYTDLRNYGRWISDEKRNEFFDPRSEEAFKFYLGLSTPEELQYLKKSKYRPTINATDQNYYSVDSDLEQDIFNAYKDKVKLNETLQTDESEFETVLSGKGGAGLLGRFGVSKGHDENGDYLSYYDKYDLKDFAQDRTKGMPYSIYNRIYYPKKQEGGKVVNPNNPIQLPNVNFVYKRPVVVSTFNPYENVNRVGTSDNTKVFRLNPEQVEKAKKAAAIRNEKIIREYYQNNQSFIGPDNRTKFERDRSIAARKAYDDLMERQKVMKQQPIYQTLQNTTAGGYNPDAAYNPVIGNTAEGLGYMAAGALGSSVARPAFNFMGEAMNLPIQGVPGFTGNNIVNAAFATHGLKSIMDGSVTKPWKEAYKSGNPWDYANAVSENAMTALELAPLVGPGYRGASKAVNYLAKQIPVKNTYTAIPKIVPRTTNTVTTNPVVADPFDDSHLVYGIDILNSPRAVVSNLASRWNMTEQELLDLAKQKALLNKKIINKSGLTKKDILAIVPDKEKDVISKMSEIEFQNTVLKPDGQIENYKPDTELDQIVYNLADKTGLLKDQILISNKEYIDEFNKHLPILDKIIAKKNKSGVTYKITGLDERGLKFYTPKQDIAVQIHADDLAEIADYKKDPLKYLINKAGLKQIENNKWMLPNNPDKKIYDSLEEVFKAANKRVDDFLNEKQTIEGESNFIVRINPGKWKGNVEDIANTEYLRSIPGLEMTNTQQGVFSDNVQRRGSGAYESINEYLKLLDLGRVKAGFNSQSESGRKAWENFVKSKRAVGFYKKPKTVHATMKTTLPYIGIGAIGAGALNKKQQGGAIIPDRGQWDYPGQVTEYPIMQYDGQNNDWEIIE